MADDGWDLHAVVRSCTASASAADNTQEDIGAQSLAATAAINSISFEDGRSAYEQTNFISFSMDSERHAKKRKSKNNKRIVEMREEELSHDGWAWRKYGQKPIKGSPYPRNYYRCSTTKDCSARKQVERSPVNPSNFIVSYSGDHLHPRPTHLSSLVGTTKTTKAVVGVTDLPEQPPCSSSSPASTSSFSPGTSLKEDETEKNHEDIQEVNFW
ncbi:putative transcription factor WRKY family [Helianthus debilis subsp. tardiflorus]